MTLNVVTALGNLPEGLRAELLDEYNKIAKNYRENRWEAAELNGGRFCEIVYSILKGQVDGTFPDRASKPDRFPDACRALEQVPKADQLQSVRVGIPRVLVGLYEIRNNRGVGHVGGDVDANHMDATYVLHAVQWVMAELVRIYHATDVTTATKVANALVDRTLPIVWKVGDKLRVLDTGLNLTDQTLLLLYHTPAGVTEKDLAGHLEQDRLANYQRVTKALHTKRLVERHATGLVELSPKGMKLIEETLLPKLDS